MELKVEDHNFPRTSSLRTDLQGGMKDVPWPGKCKGETGSNGHTHQEGSAKPVG
jgi:hypothetical protein